MNVASRLGLRKVTVASFRVHFHSTPRIFWRDLRRMPAVLVNQVDILGLRHQFEVRHLIRAVAAIRVGKLEPRIRRGVVDAERRLRFPDIRIHRATIVRVYRAFLTRLPHIWLGRRGRDRQSRAFLRRHRPRGRRRGNWPAEEAGAPAESCRSPRPGFPGPLGYAGDGEFSRRHSWAGVLAGTAGNGGTHQHHQAKAAKQPAARDGSLHV